MEVNYEAKVFTFETNADFEVLNTGTGDLTTLDASDASSSETISFDSNAMFKITAFTIAFPVSVISSNASSPYSLSRFQSEASESLLLIDGAPLSFNSETNLMPYGIYVPNGTKVSAVTRRMRRGDSDESGDYELKLRYTVFGILETQS